MGFQWIFTVPEYYSVCLFLNVFFELKIAAKLISESEINWTKWHQPLYHISVVKTCPPWAWDAREAVLQHCTKRDAGEAVLQHCTNRDAGEAVLQHCTKRDAGEAVYCNTVQTEMLERLYTATLYKHKCFKGLCTLSLRPISLSCLSSLSILLSFFASLSSHFSVSFTSSLCVHYTSLSLYFNFHSFSVKQVEYMNKVE